MPELLSILGTSLKALVAGWKAIPRVRAWIRDPHHLRRTLEQKKFWGLSWDFRGFLGMHCSSYGPIYVSCFQAACTNKSKRNFANIDGYLISNITGEKLALTVEDWDPKETNGIPAGCTFPVRVLFRHPTSVIEGLHEDEFMANWSRFTLVFEVDGKLCKFRFGKREVAKSVSRFRGENSPAANRAPTVTKKVQCEQSSPSNADVVRPPVDILPAHSGPPEESA